MGPGAEFRVLGPVDVRAPGLTRASGGPRQRAVLCALLLHANKTVQSGQLIELVWTDAPSSAESNLRTYLTRLRRLLHVPGESRSRLRTDRDGQVLTVLPGELDLARFTEHAAEGERTRDPVAASVHLERALRLWRGRPFAGVAPGPLLEAEAVRLEAWREHVREKLLAARLELGQHDMLIPELRALLTHDPLGERWAGMLMLALHRSGRRAEALEVYRGIRRELIDTVGMEPGADLRDMHQRLLAGDRVTLRDRPADHPPAQLPADVAHFSGRAEEIGEVIAAQRIIAIHGMAGVGKTALAVHAGHRLASRFTDGQLYLDLHGHSHGGAPLDPADAVERVLLALDVPASRIPPGIEARAALYRSQIADRRMLIVLDDASDCDQIRPLLPGAGASLILITCRRGLPDLDQVNPLALDVLPPEPAITMFTQVSGRLTEPVDLVADVVDLCGRLPLAVRIAASRLRDRPTWTLKHLRDRLADGRRRLTELDAGTHGVASALSLSRAALDPDHRRMLDLLGLHLGPELDRPAAAALAGLSVPTVDSLLEGLVDAHLLLPAGLGSYRLHNLVHAFVRSRARHLDPADLRRALHRLLDHYLATGRAAP